MNLKKEGIIILIVSIVLLLFFLGAEDGFAVHVLFTILALLWMPLLIKSKSVAVKYKVFLCLCLFFGGIGWYGYLNGDMKGCLNFLVIYLIAIVASVWKVSNEK